MCDHPLFGNGGTIWQASSITKLSLAAKIDSEKDIKNRRGLQSIDRKCYREHPFHTPNYQYPDCKKNRDPPFYAIPICAGITVRSGGLKVSPHCEVLNEQGSVIHGLNETGSSVGGLEGDSKACCVGGLMKAFVFGSIAGKTTTKVLKTFRQNNFGAV